MPGGGRGASRPRADVGARDGGRSGAAASEIVDGVAVTRVGVDVRSGVSKASASIRLLAACSLLPRVDVIHVHGFSQKNVPVALMARLLGKPVVLTLHTSGQDEPQDAERRGKLATWAFRSARMILPVSPNLMRRCEEAGIPASHLRLTPNGIDVDRFRPASVAERAAIRRDLGWNGHERVVAFVGFFSRDKRPDLLFRAWRRLADQGVRAKLVYVGATASPYFEIDQSHRGEIRAGAAALGRGADVVFVEPTHEMERYYRAADVFVLSSVREAHPVALLEAMACGLPCIASRIEGATDVIIEDGVNGRLVDPDDEQALAVALAQVLESPRRPRLGWAPGAGDRCRPIRHTADGRAMARRIPAGVPVLTHDDTRPFLREPSGFAQQYEALKPRIDAAIASVISRSAYISGPEVDDFQRWFASFCGVRHGIGVSSGTRALELVLRGLNIGSRRRSHHVRQHVHRHGGGHHRGGRAAGARRRRRGHRQHRPEPDEARHHVEDEGDHSGAPLRPSGGDARDSRRREAPKTSPSSKTPRRRTARSIGGARAGSLATAGLLQFLSRRRTSAPSATRASSRRTTTGLAARIGLLRDHGRVSKYEHEIVGYTARLDNLQAAVLRVQADMLDEWNAAAPPGGDVVRAGAAGVAVVSEGRSAGRVGLPPVRRARAEARRVPRAPRGERRRDGDSLSGAGAPAARVPRAGL